ncbi:MAG: SRPBCC family protein [Kineosporiaceae bacterium]|nr:SRPBCC family protein [Aeromicrobium sp.]
MELVHRFTVPASIEVTWAAFNDLEGVAPCFPGATLASVEGDDFTGSVKVKLGPIAMLYNGTGRFVERDEVNHRAVIEAKGKDKRGNGTAGATVIAQLTPDGTGTAVEVTTDLSITGKPAQFGRGVIQDVSDKLLGIFVDCIAAKLGPEGESGTEPTPAAENPGASTAGVPLVPGAAATTGIPVTPEHARAQPTAKPVEAAELNLLSTVMPVLLKRYALPVAAVVVVIIAIIIWAKN